MNGFDPPGSADKASGASPSVLKPSEVLAKAADLIEPEGAWIQHCLARNADGGQTQTYADPEAVSFCAIGALLHVSYPQSYKEARDRLAKALGGSITSFNNAPGRTQAEVVAALRKTSDVARSEGQ